MRVAVCFSGQPRHLERCFASIQLYLLRPNNADVYFHFWSCHPSTTHFWSHSEDVHWKVLEEDRITTLLQPKAHMFEPQVEFDDSQYKEARCPAFNVLSWTYSSAICQGLYDPGEYDVVVHCRPDLFFRKEVKLEMPGENEFFVEYRGTPGDQFAYGRPEVMLDFAMFHDTLPELYDQVGYMHCETMLLQHMLNCGREVRQAEVEYTLWRQEHEQA